MSKKVCGLFLVRVDTSEHNNNGKCPCLNCQGNHCFACEQYKKTISENFNGLVAKCNACKCGKQR